MGRRRKTEQRVLGPYYKHKRCWAIVLVRPSGVAETEYFHTESEATRAADVWRKAIGQPGEQTIRECLDAYEKARREGGELKEVSVAETARRLDAFFPDKNLLLRQFDKARAVACYEAFAERKKTIWRDGKRAEGTEPISADYHRNTLIEARSFARWCVGQGWIRENPFDGIDGKGRRKHGKPQLRVDEARAWTAKAIELADQGDVGAMAALLSLLLGVRCSEITKRRVRDIDDNGRLFWIDDTKTEAGRRALEIPEMARPYLLWLTVDREPTDPLWVLPHWRDWPRHQVKRICRLAGVPSVSAHAMRGLHSTLAIQAGTTSHVVAASLGHEDFSTTTTSYAKPEAVQQATSDRTLKVLQGGVR